MSDQRSERQNLDTARHNGDTIVTLDQMVNSIEGRSTRDRFDCALLATTDGMTIEQKGLLPHTGGDSNASQCFSGGNIKAVIAAVAHQIESALDNPPQILNPARSSRSSRARMFEPAHRFANFGIS